MSLVEVEFKGCRKGIYSNPQEFPLHQNDLVVVSADRGEDIGCVSLSGTEWEERLTRELELEEVEPVLRRAKKEDIENLNENLRLAKEARGVFRDFVIQNELEMKLVDADYQLDHKKLTFYFTADGRVDFRSLVKDLAQHFRTRIDLRQIGARDEAKRLGGIGICGQEVCCSMWIRDFQPVTTNMVKEQHLLLNPQKNTGLCGRLRCCLRYEVDQYQQVNILFPRLETNVTGPRGDGIVEKIDMCSQSCGITWKDGNRCSFNIEEMKSLSDWNPEAPETMPLITFHKDPSVEEEKSGILVATAEPDEAIDETDRSSSVENKKIEKEETHGKRSRTRLREKKQAKSHTGSQKVEIVEMTPSEKSLRKKTTKPRKKRSGGHKSSK